MNITTTGYHYYYLLLLYLTCTSSVVVEGFTTPLSTTTKQVKFSIQHTANPIIHKKNNVVTSLNNYKMISDPPLLSSSTRSSTTRMRMSSSSSSVEEGEEEPATPLPAATFNLIKAAVGSGVLAFPSGVAAFADKSVALLPASALMISLGVLSGYSFYMLGRLCADEGASSIGEAWEKTVGPSGTSLIDISCIITPLGAALAYSIMLGDIFSSLATSFGATGALASRQTSILAITSLFLYPLCKLKSLAVLSPMSIIGVMSSMATGAFMGFRWLSGAYSLPNGSLLATVPEALKPSFGARGVSVLSPSSLILLAMAGTGYMCHFLAPDFYNSLENKSLPRYKKMTAIGFSAVAFASVAFMAFGFLTFGGNCSGLILNNYSTNDIGASVCRFLTAVSLIGSYPLVFAGIRANLLDLVYHGKTITDKVRKTSTKAILAVVTGLALALENAGFVVSLNGAVMGSAIIYIFPALMFLSQTKKKITQKSIEMTKNLRLERLLNKFLVCLGIFLAIAGAGVSVVDSFFPGVL